MNPSGLILVPTSSLSNLLKAKLGRMPLNEDPPILLPIFQELLDSFKVSGEMLLYRMQKEKLVKSIY